jgi:hypothetical protein
MSKYVTIESVTANTPVDVYYCDSMSAGCIFVSAITFSPFSFVVPSPYSDTDFVIKLVDSQTCVDGEVILVTPTQTQTNTPTQTPTNTITPSPTITQTTTPTQTPTTSVTTTVTPTTTPTVTPSPTIICNTIGQSQFDLSSNACSDSMTIVCLFNYISDATITPIIGITLYQTSVNGVLFNPYNGNNKWIKMSWVSGLYAVQINSNGEILDFVSC